MLLMSNQRNLTSDELTTNRNDLLSSLVCRCFRVVFLPIENTMKIIFPFDGRNPRDWWLWSSSRRIVVKNNLLSACSDEKARQQTRAAIIGFGFLCHFWPSKLNLRPFSHVCFIEHNSHVFVKIDFWESIFRRTWQCSTTIHLPNVALSLMTENFHNNYSQTFHYL